jgi:KaiC domain protein
MSDEEEDWFERALRESEADEAGADPEASGGEESGEDSEDAAGVEGVAADEREDGDDGTGDDVDATTDEGPDFGDFGDFDGTEDGSDSDGSAGGDEAPDDTADGDDPFGDDAGFGDFDSDAGGAPDAGGGNDDPFGEDFATALENAPDPSGGGGGGGGGGPDAGFGDMGGGGDTDFGGMGGGNDAGFGDMGGGGEDVGFGGGGGGTDSFDDEELDSDIERLQIGIDGLDEMILGGIPKRSLMVAVGSAGTGKTTFGMQFLHQALETGEKAVYISLEEGRDRVLSTADEKGWEFSQYERDGQLAIVDFDPVEMANSLSSIQNELPRLIDAFGAERVVLDSVSLLEMMYDSPAKRRSEVFDFTKALKSAGVTTFVTSEANAENPYQSKYGIIEYLADAVFVLQYVRPSDFRETRLAVEIQKIRDANHSRETKPYEITGEGISVYRQANIF